MSETFAAPASLRMESALAIEAQGLAAIAAGTTHFDLAALSDLDSSAVAVLLSWRRRAAERNMDLEFSGATPSLMQLAELYGVTDLTIGKTSDAAS